MTGFPLRDAGRAKRKAGEGLFLRRYFNRARGVGRLATNELSSEIGSLAGKVSFKASSSGADISSAAEFGVSLATDLRCMGGRG